MTKPAVIVAVAEPARPAEVPHPEVGDEASGGPAGEALSGEPASEPGASGLEVVDDHPAPGTWVVRDVEPEIVTRVVPPYPEFAYEAHVEGTVFVQVLVGRDGRVSEAIVRRGDPMLCDAALAAARATRFRPASANGHPVAVWVLMPFRFVLR